MKKQLITEFLKLNPSTRPIKEEGVSFTLTEIRLASVFSRLLKDFANTVSTEVDVSYSDFKAFIARSSNKTILTQSADIGPIARFCDQWNSGEPSASASSPIHAHVVTSPGALAGRSAPEIKKSSREKVEAFLKDHQPSRSLPGLVGLNGESLSLSERRSIKIFLQLLKKFVSGAVSAASYMEFKRFIAKSSNKKILTETANIGFIVSFCDEWNSGEPSASADASTHAHVVKKLEASASRSAQKPAPKAKKNSREEIEAFLQEHPFARPLCGSGVNKQPYSQIEKKSARDFKGLLSEFLQTINPKVNSIPFYEFLDFISYSKYPEIIDKVLNIDIILKLYKDWVSKPPDIHRTYMLTETADIPLQNLVFLDGRYEDIEEIFDNMKANQAVGKKVFLNPNKHPEELFSEEAIQQLRDHKKTKKFVARYETSQAYYEEYDLPSVFYDQLHEYLNELYEIGLRKASISTWGFGELNEKEDKMRACKVAQKKFFDNLVLYCSPQDRKVLEEKRIFNKLRDKTGNSSTVKFYNLAQGVAPYHCMVTQQVYLWSMLCAERPGLSAPEGLLRHSQGVLWDLGPLESSISLPSPNGLMIAMTAPRPFG